MARITLNGKSYDLPDNSSISIIDNAIYVDGKRFIEQKVNFDIINIEGDIHALHLDKGSVVVTGDAEVINAGGNVTVGKTNG